MLTALTFAKYLLFIILLHSPFYCVSGIASPLKISALAQAKDCQINFAWSTWSPFMQSDKGEVKGYQIDLIQWIAEELHCQLNLYDVNWFDTVEMIKTGKIDMTGRASKLKERRAYAYFSDSYRSTLLVLQFRKGDSQQYFGNDLKQILNKGVIVGVGKGVYYGASVENLRKQFKYQNQFRVYPLEAHLYQAMLNREIDTFFSSPFTMDKTEINSFDRRSYNHLIEEYPLETIFDDLHFMFSKKTINKEFVGEFNKALKKIRKSKQYLQHEYWSSIK